MYVLYVHAVPSCVYGNECMMLMGVGCWQGRREGRGIDYMYGIFGR
jgi:hypothetical protein